MQCINYVKQYANTPQEVENFPRAWLEGVQKQLDHKHEVIKAKAEEHYKQYRKQWIETVNSKTSKTEVLQLKHWRGIGREKHQKRLDEMMKTDWRMIVARGPILRPLPNSTTSHLEVWEVYQSPEIWGTRMCGQPYEMYYEWFCKLCGYDPQL